MGQEKKTAEAGSLAKRDQGPSPRRWLQYLAWAGAGFAVARWLAGNLGGPARNSRRGGGRAPSPAQASPQARVGVEAGPATEAPEPEGPNLELPGSTELIWVPGPSGSSRVAQLNSEGPIPVIFVHGLGGNLGQWAPIFHLMGPGLRPIAFDLPGHGESDAESSPSIANMAASLGAVADALQLRRFVLVGHSLGTAVAIEYAAKHRNRVAGLLLIDPNGDQSQIDAGERQRVLRSLREDAHGELGWHFRHVIGNAPEAVVDKVLADLEATPPENLHDSLESSFQYSPVPALRAFDGPVRAILSTMNDLPYSLHRLVPDLEVAILPEVGHWLMIERPDEVFDLLEKLLESCSGRLERVH